MNSILGIRWVIAISLGVSFISGCSSGLLKPWTPTSASASTSSSTPTPNSSTQFDQLVSKDIVSVFMQVNRLSPATTTLGTSAMGSDNDAFAEALNNAFQDAGYAIRSVGASPATIPLSFQLESPDQSQASTASQTSRTVTVTVGDVAVRREYVTDANGQITPVGGMEVKGVVDEKLQLNDQIFATPSGKDEPDDSPAPFTEEVAPRQQIADSGALPSTRPYARPLSSLQQNSQPLAYLSAALPSESNRPLLDIPAPSIAIAEPLSQSAFASLAEKDTENMIDLQQSNFDSLFNELGIVDEKILTFANDSTRMGSVSKARIRELVNDFDPAQDIFSVVGCSLGPTGYSGGQEGLARGRAERVKEELLYAGVPSDQILAEGCWAEDAFDERMPRRGVVVSLKRPVT